MDELKIFYSKALVKCEDVDKSSCEINLWCAIHSLQSSLEGYLSKRDDTSSEISLCLNKLKNSLAIFSSFNFISELPNHFEIWFFVQKLEIKLLKICQNVSKRSERIACYLYIWQNFRTVCAQILHAHRSTYRHYQNPARQQKSTPTRIFLKLIKSWKLNQIVYSTLAICYRHMLYLLS